jgi:hypothetical protein
MEVGFAAAVLINAAQVALLMIVFGGWALYTRATDFAVHRGSQPSREKALLERVSASYCGERAAKRSAISRRTDRNALAEADSPSTDSNNSEISASSRVSCSGVARASARVRLVASAPISSMMASSSCAMGVDAATDQLFAHFTGGIDEFIAAGGLSDRA